MLSLFAGKGYKFSMLLLTCEKCQTQYRLGPEALGKIGREVRCTRCKHQWFQPAPEGPVRSSSSPESTAGGGDASFAQVMAEINAAIQQGADPIPESVRPASLPVTRAPLPPPPFSFKAEARTALLSFLLMAIVSFGVAIPARGAIVSLWPPAALLFDTIGFDVPVTGEGLRLSDLTAAYREEGGGTFLDVNLKVTNIAERSVKYPAFKVILQGRTESLKEWRLEKEGQNWLGPGNSTPLSFSFPDVHKGGVSVAVTFSE